MPHTPSFDLEPSARQLSSRTDLPGGKRRRHGVWKGGQSSTITAVQCNFHKSNAKDLSGIWRDSNKNAEENASNLELPGGKIGSRVRML